ncbi:MAG: hypothetical protein Q9174_006285, partial [Haloplaca sp. 1 TL-2023]
MLIVSSTPNLQHLCCPTANGMPLNRRHRWLAERRALHGHPTTIIAQHREYATVGDENRPRSDDDGLPWPESISASAPPTPYQIFQMEKTALYSKRRFYELVKLYHPDRHAHFCNLPQIDRLSPDTKMKRYRLVVAANDILSDPSRRKAYDQCEAGWSSHPDIDGPAHSRDFRTKSRWSGYHEYGSPARNATWEDWEKWYQRDTKPPQTPVYFSNGGFVFLVAFVAAASAVGQASRVDDHKTRFNERAELVHTECNKNLQQRRNETRELSDKDQTALRLAHWRYGRSGTGLDLHTEDLIDHG